MTIEEANTFLNNLKVCIEEHPIVADWLVEIADRKTEPTCSKMEQVDKDTNVRSKDEPQTDCNGCKFVGTYDTEFPCANCSRKIKDYYAKDEPQTKRPCDNCQEFDCYGCEYKQTERSE